MVPLVVDQFGKVTVSLGGRCPIGCRHCYTMTRQFVASEGRTPDEVVAALRRRRGDFSIICLSGDTDPFVDETSAIELLDLMSQEFTDCDIEFTTRMVPSATTVSAIAATGERMAARRRLLVPAVSFVSPRLPNVSESAHRVPPVADRFALLEHLSDAGLPTFMALRPTFPFSLVSREEVFQLIQCASACCTAVLGETFILDSAGHIARRLTMPTARCGDRESEMSFLPQPGIWRKRTLPEETEYARGVCTQVGLPYFLRSGSAIYYLRDRWDFRLRRVRTNCASANHVRMDHIDP